MKLGISQIKISERLRTSPGNLLDLADSIKKVGLLNPIIVDEHYVLISGFRRLKACESLGWTEIEARIIQSDDDKLLLLDMEFHENFGRLPLTFEEQEKFKKQRIILLTPPKKNWFISILNFIKEKFLILINLFKKTKSR